MASALVRQPAMTSPSGPLRSNPRTTPTSSSSRNRPSASNGPRESFDTLHSSSNGSKGHGRHGSAGSRGGREFRVGNIGNNGLLYLKPVKRASDAPATSSVESSIVPFEPTSIPADTADSMWRESFVSNTETYQASVPRQSLAANTLANASHPRPLVPHKQANVVPAAQTRASRSASQADPSNRSFKVVIDRSTDETTGKGSLTAPLYDVSIPHYRLGTPHFTGKGSAILHSSINTGSSPADLEHASDGRALKPDMPNSRRPLNGSRQPVDPDRPLSIPPSQTPSLASDRFSLYDFPTPGSHLPRRKQKKGEALDFEQVRFSAITGQILAASIPELIVRITSPERLDYDLLSDFFLAFRLFMSPRDLASRLIDRLRHSVGGSDDVSRIIRVRTFVALRHWILNYFVDDFLSDLALRVAFCQMVNELCHGLSVLAGHRAGDLRILGELKKCWKHTCALFWDIPTQPSHDYADDDILPGGIVGSRSSQVDPEDVELSRARSTSHPRSHMSHESAQFLSQYATNKTAELQLSMAPSVRSRHVPADSRQSLQVLSCTLPRPALAAAQKLSRADSSGPRPIKPGSSAQPSSYRSPAASVGSRRHHNRSGSFSDARRDDRAPLSVSKGSEIDELVPAPIILPGSLIRGAMLPPSMPFVETVVPDAHLDDQATSAFRDVEELGPTEESEQNHQFVNPGMRKLLGSMRRALSVRNNVARPLSATWEERSDNISGSANHPPFPPSSNVQQGTPKRKLVGGRARLRVDILAAEVSEVFKIAVREVTEARNAAPIRMVEPLHQSLNQQASTSPLLLPGAASSKTLKVRSDVTMGSRSIIIADDTAGQMTPDFKKKMEPLPVPSPDAEASNHGDDTQKLQTVPIFLEATDRGNNQHDVHAISQSASPVMTETDQGPSKEAELSPMDKLQIPTINEPQQRASANTELTHSSFQPSVEADTTLSGASETSTFHMERKPGQGLRRIPGGNLKAVNHVHSLDAQGLKEQNLSRDQLGLSPQIPPRRSSTKAAQVLGDKITDSNLAKQHEALRPSASQPMMRPSFEKEVAKLAQLPDHDDEGGIESALRKLEGRGQETPGEPPEGYLAALAKQVEDFSSPVGAETGQKPIDSTIIRQHREDEVLEYSEPHNLGTGPSGGRLHHGDAQPQIAVEIKSLSVAESDAARSSIPLFERDASHPPRPNFDLIASEALHSHPDPSRAPGPVLHDGLVDRQDDSLGPSQDLRDVDSVNESPIQSVKRRTASSKRRDSFLVNDAEPLSSLSSETPDDASQEEAEQQARRLPLVSGEPVKESINSTMDQHVRDSMPLQPMQSTKSKQTASAAQMPPTVLPPTRSVAGSGGQVAAEIDSDRPSAAADRPAIKSKSADNLLDMRSSSHLGNSPGAAHLPFVLGYDSLLLAQQFTVIEKDALCEVEWRDLIDLRWNQAATHHNNWVDYLRASGSDADSQQLRPGIDMCFARFNIVVRWVKSEIVMTHDIHERAAAIIKYIHISQHARALRNWATMCQITIALVSSDVHRLKQTWTLVPDKDQHALKQLEDLIMPTRNFHNLRTEIETATATWDQGGGGGCIPFIGIYTHDLIYNAQKPMWVRATATDAEGVVTQDGPPTLVNFERHHTAATIVKNLLRLIEASTKYTFQPMPEIASRCLWIGALTEEDISRRSRELEPMERGSA